jgi:hypothetical protein
MNLKESTLKALEDMNVWANYIDVYNYMVNNNYNVGKSKTPEKSVASELYKYGEAGVIEKRKNGALPEYKAKK